MTLTTSDRTSTAQLGKRKTGAQSLLSKAEGGHDGVKQKETDARLWHAFEMDGAAHRSLSGGTDR